MSIFFPDILDDFLKLPFLQRVKKKYHFEEHQMDELKAVAVQDRDGNVLREFSYEMQEGVVSECKNKGEEA